MALKQMPHLPAKMPGLLAVDLEEADGWDEEGVTTFRPAVPMIAELDAEQGPPPEAILRSKDPIARAAIKAMARPDGKWGCSIGVLTFYAGVIGEDVDASLVTRVDVDPVGKHAVALVAMCPAPLDVRAFALGFALFDSERCEPSTEAGQAIGSLTLLKSLGIKPMEQEHIDIFGVETGPFFDSALMLAGRIASGVALLVPDRVMDVKSTVKGRTVKKTARLMRLKAGTQPPYDPGDVIELAAEKKEAPAPDPEFECARCAQTKPVDEKREIDGGVSVCSACLAKLEGTPTPTKKSLEFERKAVYRACSSKIRYSTLQEADAAAAAEKRTPLRSYKCDYCSGYHCTTKSYKGETFNEGLVPVRLTEKVGKTSYVFLVEDEALAVSHNEVLGKGILVATKEWGKDWRDLKGAWSRQWQMWTDLQPQTCKVTGRAFEHAMADCKARSEGFAITTDAKPMKRQKPEPVVEPAVPAVEPEETIPVPVEGFEAHIDPTPEPEVIDTVDGPPEIRDRILAMLGPGSDIPAEFVRGALWALLESKTLTLSKGEKP